MYALLQTIFNVIKLLKNKTFSDLSTLVVFGRGIAKRQFLFVEDFAHIIWSNLFSSDIRDKICAPKEEYTIAELVDILSKMGGKNVEYDTSKSDGQIRKFAQSKYDDDYAYTSLEDGLKTTASWYKENVLLKKSDEKG